MKILVRGYEPADSSAAVAVYRSSHESMRRSRGGMHPDGSIDAILGKSDSELLLLLTGSCSLFVAIVEETGQMVGIGGFTITPAGRLLGSTLSRNLYVREDFQKGRAGVNVGKILRSRILEEARRQGFRKIYGFSTPEAVEFHRKFGAVFFPSFDKTVDSVNVSYYEIELRKSLMNRLRAEPYLMRLASFLRR
ncbi:MAG: hypothetical protein U0R44_03075 [Candidatus Micrarchaeia archaeon]